MLSERKRFQTKGRVENEKRMSGPWRKSTANQKKRIAQEEGRIKAWGRGIKHEGDITGTGAAGGDYKKNGWGGRVRRPGEIAW